MDFWTLALPPVFGFVIGYITNAVAIGMLFRPFEEVRFLGLRFQGMIPRRKPEIARSVARIVASDLLKEERVAQRIAGEDVRRAFEVLILDLTERCSQRDYGPLRDLLGEERAEAAVRAVNVALTELAQTLGEWVSTPAGVSTTASLIEVLLDRTPFEFVPDEEVSLQQGILGKITGALASPDLAEKLGVALRRAVARLGSSERTLGQLIPPEVHEVLLRTVKEPVPALLRRFEEALLSPQNVEKIKGAVRSGIRAYLSETEGGILKNVVRQLAILGRGRIFREVDEVVDANIYRLRELVYEEENRAHLEASIGEAVDAVLARAPGELFDRMSSDDVDRLCDQAAGWLCDQMRRPGVLEALTQGFEREFGRLFRTPFRELAAISGAEADAADRWARKIGCWAAAGGLQTVVRWDGGSLAAGLLDVPIGRPARFLPSDLLLDITRLGLDHLMPVVARKVPEILRIVDVQGLIEREVLQLSPKEVERVILTVAKRELWAITWWGGVLGAAVGGVQSALWSLRP
jgi:uncharacterized membrane protein YheB (UPF0754 family)